MIIDGIRYWTTAEVNEVIWVMSLLISLSFFGIVYLFKQMFK